MEKLQLFVEILKCIHFGPGTFTVSVVATLNSFNEVSHIVVAGTVTVEQAGNKSSTYGGGGGAGGFRENKSGVRLLYSKSFKWSRILIGPVTATGYPITVGGGGPTRSRLC